MGEKVIHEVRFVETDDGFRIEVKGDKERLRKMGFGHGFGPGMGFGPRFGHRFRHGRRGHWGRGFSPWGWWWDDEPEPGDEPPAE